MAQETILDYKRLEIKHIESADEEILSLLGKTVLGTRGRLRYSVLNIGERVKYYGKGLSFIGLYKRNSLAGVIGLCRRKTTTCGREYNSTFLRYLSVRGSFQVARVSDHRSEKLANIENSFKQKIFSLFGNPSDIPGITPDPSEPHVVYACVDSENERSRNFVRQAGYDHLRSFDTIAFSRFSPKMKPGVIKLSPEEEPAMAILLADQYRDYSFYTSEFSFLDHRYYIMKNRSEIIAGVLALPTIFRIINFPGIQGWVLMNLMPHFPFLKKIFSPGEFGFLVLDSIYCREGSEHLLPDLFESVCAMESYNSAITWHDDQSGLCKSLKSLRRMGLMNRILKTKPGILYASFSNVSPEEKKKFLENPAFLAGIDFA